MATVGQPLTSPEAGWRRYDNTHPAINYIGSWGVESNASAYGGSVKKVYQPSGVNPNEYVEFKFVGTKIRIIARTFSNQGKDAIELDGVKTVVDTASMGNKWQTLIYEATGLENKVHTVKFYNETGQYTSGLDAIDIDSTGRLLHPDEVTDIADLDVGKRIRCHYQASSGQVGVFSGLGQETSDFIPPASSATPNGDFYWICCDIKNGKKILLADRNIQHSISWDKINEQGMTNTGREITF